ncbi:MAG: hypothetical protein ACK5B9_09075 [Flavobacteriia bacterium]|jgi:hypothetical protein
MKILSILPLCFFLLACQGKKSTSKDNIPNDEAIEYSWIENAASAKSWLVDAIETTFKEKEGDNPEIFTKNYYAYKSDAIGVGYDGGMDENVFTAKWKKDFDCKFSGMGTGFLISGQDWSTIKVTKCNLISSEKDEDFIFDVIIHDDEANFDYKRKIDVRSEKEQFLIQDVLEFN